MNPANSTAIIIPVPVINASVHRPLSAFRNIEITDILEHDMSFTASLFPVAKGALFAQKVGFGVRVKVSFIADSSQ